MRRFRSIELCVLLCLVFAVSAPVVGQRSVSFNFSSDLQELSFDVFGVPAGSTISYQISSSGNTEFSGSPHSGSIIVVEFDTPAVGMAGIQIAPGEGSEIGELHTFTLRVTVTRSGRDPVTFTKTLVLRVVAGSLRYEPVFTLSGLPSWTWAVLGLLLAGLVALVVFLE